MDEVKKDTTWLHRLEAYFVVTELDIRRVTRGLTRDDIRKLMPGLGFVEVKNPEDKNGLWCQAIYYAKADLDPNLQLIYCREVYKDLEREWEEKEGRRLRILRGLDEAAQMASKLFPGFRSY